MINYPVGDFLIQIKNSAKVGKQEVTLGSSKFIKAVALALEKEKILSKVSLDNGKITVGIAYHKKEPVLMNLKLVSKPGLRRYMGVDELKSRKRARSTIMILSTPLGILSSREAIKKQIGGEVIVEIW